MANFNAGLRLLSVLEYLKMTQTDLTAIVGGYQSKVSTWSKKERFSPTILKKLRRLEEKGINPEYFAYESEPMLIRDKEVLDPIYLIKQLQKENAELAEKLEKTKKKLNKCKEAVKVLASGQEKQ
ncbi:hypothetical protein [Haliscomenobacter sp.]|uniref:hypothetical protein n=1 Tax=Haliscomenobacter sp. TaxID=2717303 RepID=UPI003BACF6A5